MAKNKPEPPKKRVVNRVKELLAIKERHEGRRISQRRLAEETGLSKLTVDRWVLNEVSRMDEGTLLAFCSYFDVTPGDLLILEDDPDAGQIKSQLLATA